MLDADQKTHLAGIRKLLGATDIVAVRHAFALLDSLDDRALTAVVTAGITVDDRGNVIAAEGSEIARRVRTPLRDEAACWAALHADHLADVTALRLARIARDPTTGPEWPVERLTRFSALRTITFDGLTRATAEQLPLLPTITHISIAHAHVDTLAWLAKLPGLQTIEVFGGDLRDLDSLPELPDLTSLALRGCEALREVRALRGRVRLTGLDLARCTALESLEGLEGLRALTTLDLHGCAALRALRGLPQAPGLTALDLRDADALEDLTGLGGLSGVRTLWLRRCGSLRTLHGAQDLSALETLDLRGCEGLATLQGLRGVPALTEVLLDQCPHLTDVDALAEAPRLARASLSGCARLRSVAGLGGARDLVALDLTGCKALDDIDALADLPQLATPTLDGVPPAAKARYTRRRKARTAPLASDQRKRLASVRALLGAKDLASVVQALELLEALEDPAMLAIFVEGVSLDADGAPALREGCEVHVRVRAPLRAHVALWALGHTPAAAAVAHVSLSDASLDLSALARFSSLGSLRLVGCAVSTLTPLRALPLHTVHLERCEGLASLAGLPDSLAALTVRSCAASRDLGALVGLPALRALAVEHPAQGTSLDALTRLTALTSLTMLGDSTLRDADIFRGLGALETLRLHACTSLEDVSALSGAPLFTLEISDCGAITRPTLVGLPNLHTLDLSGNDALQDLSGLRELPALRRLEARNCGLLTDLGPLSALPTLEEAIVGGSDVRDLTPLASLPQLAVLDAGSCPVRYGLEAIARLTTLRTLDLARPWRDTDESPALAPLAALTGLESLDLTGQQELAHLGVLAGMAGLRSLSVCRCPNLRDIAALAGLTALERLSTTQCPRIEDFTPITHLPALRQWSRWGTVSMQARVVTTLQRMRRECEIS